MVGVLTERHRECRRQKRIAMLEDVDGDGMEAGH